MLQQRCCGCVCTQVHRSDRRFASRCWRALAAPNLPSTQVRPRLPLLLLGRQAARAHSAACAARPQRPNNRWAAAGRLLEEYNLIPKFLDRDRAQRARDVRAREPSHAQTMYRSLPIPDPNNKKKEPLDNANGMKERRNIPSPKGGEKRVKGRCGKPTNNARPVGQPRCLWRTQAFAASAIHRPALIAAGGAAGRVL